MEKSKSRKMLLFPQEKSKSKPEDNLTSSCQRMAIGGGGKGGGGDCGWCGRLWWQPVLREREREEREKQGWEHLGEGGK
jgi:hypothetical protein